MEMFSLWETKEAECLVFECPLQLLTEGLQKMERRG